MKRLSLLVVPVLILLSHSSASAGECPVALSIPAPEWQVECKAEANATRCGSGLSHAVCRDNNDRALRNGLLTQQAYHWLDTNGFCAVNIDGVHTIVAICPVGCFEENTAILSLSKDGGRKWVAAKRVTRDDRLLGLRANALLSSPELGSRAIQRFVYGEERNDLYVFSLSNGRELRVTQHHGMVLADGRVVEAREVVEGDLFIAVGGSEVSVVSIRREPTDADVYNFFLAVDTPQEHVIAAEGVLVGDLAWQSTLASELDSISLRR